VDYDREFVADTIILNAWLKEIPHVSKEFVRKKCISAWRTMKRERKRNEEATRVGATRSSTMVIQPQPGGASKASSAPNAEAGEQEEVDRKMLVEEAVGCLSPFERRLIWMRYYDSQTLEEIAGNVTLRREQVQQALKIALYKMRVHLT
jgi:RNA polymerase sigma factor (sigma-70 family)